MEPTTDTEKALAYYKSGMLHEAPPYVPARVTLHSRVRGDGPFADTFADAGEHDCESNRWGAISVRATNGKMLGVKPAEFDVVAWRSNEPAQGRSREAAESRGAPCSASAPDANGDE